MIALLILTPALAGLAAFALSARAALLRLLLAATLAHAVLTAAAWMSPPAPLLDGWLVVDAAGRLFLGITSALFLMVGLYTADYLKCETHPDQNQSEKVLIGCLLLFLAALTLVSVSHHFGLLWFAVETTTLASAPLVYFHKHARSLEATWKYLLICSVGIALALLGNFFLAVAYSDGGNASLLLEDMMKRGEHVHLPWLKAAFICILIGYGTKMGLTPLHTWLPDAHSESPSLVSALLSGVLLNGAFLAILRALQICHAAGLGDFARELLLLFGIISMALAVPFLLRSFDYKRMLAYSSVEHMGILSVGAGLGGMGAFASLFHAVNHSLTKAMLFLLAGNILAVYKTKSADNVRGLLGSMPVTAVLWIGGFLAITGSPPFGTFVSELTILRAALDQGRMFVGVAFLLALALSFIGMSGAMLRMAQGDPDISPQAVRPETWLGTLPPAVFGAAVLLLGLYLPDFLGATLEDAAQLLRGAP